MMSTVTKLAKANVRENKTRSILIIMAIMLTTLLLTAVSGAGYGMIRMQKLNTARLYGDYYGSYQNVTMENIGEMKRNAAFDAMGMVVHYGEVDHRKNLTLNWLDAAARQMLHMDSALTQGHYPEAEDEILAAPGFFRELGLDNPQIGDSVEIAFRTDLKSAYASETFVICGFMAQPEVETNSMSAYTAQKHFEKSVAAPDRRYTVLFRLDDSIGITYDSAGDVMEELAVRCGIDVRDVAVNNRYLMWKLDPGTETIMVCAAVCMVVVLFSVIVIYNIFQVGIIQKVQEYGKLRAAGATRKQMKGVVLREGMYLACAGVPVGLLGGIALAKGVMEYLTGELRASGIAENMTYVSVVSIPLLVLMAALAFFTVWLALRKPMRVASSISPVEAMRYQEGGKRAGLRRGRDSLNVFSLTLANLSSHRKRTVSTILSMGLSCVLFVVLANWLGNMDEKYMAREEVAHGQFQLELTFNLTDEAYPQNNLNHVLEDNPLNGELIQKIREIPEVTEVRTQSILYARRLDAAGNEIGDPLTVLVLDREDFDWRVKNDEIKGLDYDGMSAQDAVCYGTKFYLEENGYAIGETYHFSLYDGVAKKVWNPQMTAAFVYLGAHMAMTRDTYEKMGFAGVTNYAIWVDCAESDVETVGTALESLTQGMGRIETESYQNQLKVARFSMRTLKLPAYLFCVIVAFISFMNMANTMITSMVTRKQEFGVLQAVGMTNSQLDQSLQLEGILLSVGTAGVSLVTGVPLGYALFRYCKANAFVGLGVYHFPVGEVLFLFVFIGVLQMALSFVLSRNVRRESLVERIRYHG